MDELTPHTGREIELFVDGFAAGLDAGIIAARPDLVGDPEARAAIKRELVTGLANRFAAARD